MDGDEIANDILELLTRLTCSGEWRQGHGAEYT